jgi:hypothetical protein
MNRQLMVISTLALCMAIIEVARAQGTLYVSNLTLPTSGSSAVGADSWLAASFRTGANPYGYRLDSVHFSMAPASGVTSGFAASLYASDNNGDPGSFLAALNGLDPSAGGVFAYTAAGIDLSPESSYFLVMTAESLSAVGSFQWSLANSSHGYESVDGWIIGAGYQYSSDGVEWSFTRPLPLQFGVGATAVPEPSTFFLALLGLGLLALGRWGRRAAASSG